MVARISGALLATALIAASGIIQGCGVLQEDGQSYVNKVLQEDGQRYVNKVLQGEAAQQTFGNDGDEFDRGKAEVPNVHQSAAGSEGPGRLHRPASYFGRRGDGKDRGGSIGNDCGRRRGTDPRALSGREASRTCATE